MEGTDPTLIGSFPSAFGFLGDLLFRWVPAVVSAVIATDPNTAATSTPLSAGSIPAFLAYTSGPANYDALARGWVIFTLISFAVSIPFIAVSIYCWVRILQIRHRERLGFRAAQRTVESKDTPKTHLRWRRIMDQMSAGTPESWRLAILEADIMLNELLDLQGYKGETMADKMKQVDRASFNTIDLAWEAHKVRNRIAHEGANHEISSREARRVISLYEHVFKEFRIVE
jgi:hypothetical protein